MRNSFLDFLHVNTVHYGLTFYPKNTEHVLPHRRDESFACFSLPGSIGTMLVKHNVQENVITVTLFVTFENDVQPALDFVETLGDAFFQMILQTTKLSPETVLFLDMEFICYQSLAVKGNL